MSISGYVDTFAPEPSWLARIRAKSKLRGADKLSMTKINAMISDVRRSAKKPVTAPTK